MGNKGSREAEGGATQFAPASAGAVPAAAAIDSHYISCGASLASSAAPLSDLDRMSATSRYAEEYLANSSILAAPIAEEGVSSPTLAPTKQQPLSRFAFTPPDSPTVAARDAGRRDVSLWTPAESADLDREFSLAVRRGAEAEPESPPQMPSTRALPASGGDGASTPAPAFAFAAPDAAAVSPVMSPTVFGLPAAGAASSAPVLMPPTSGQLTAPAAFPAAAADDSPTAAAAAAESPSAGAMPPAVLPESQVPLEEDAPQVQPLVGLHADKPEAMAAAVAEPAVMAAPLSTGVAAAVAPAAALEEAPHAAVVFPHAECAASPAVAAEEALVTAAPLAEVEAPAQVAAAQPAALASMAPSEDSASLVGLPAVTSSEAEMIVAVLAEMEKPAEVLPAEPAPTVAEMDAEEGPAALPPPVAPAALAEALAAVAQDLPPHSTPGGAADLEVQAAALEAEAAALEASRSSAERAADVEAQAAALEAEAAALEAASTRHVMAAQPAAGVPLAQAGGAAEGLYQSALRMVKPPSVVVPADDVALDMLQHSTAAAREDGHAAAVAPPPPSALEASLKAAQVVESVPQAIQRINDSHAVAPHWSTNKPNSTFGGSLFGGSLYKSAVELVGGDRRDTEADQREDTPRAAAAASPPTEVTSPSSPPRSLLQLLQHSDSSPDSAPYSVSPCLPFPPRLAAPGGSSAAAASVSEPGSPVRAPQAQLFPDAFYEAQVTVTPKKAFDPKTPLKVAMMAVQDADAAQHGAAAAAAVEVLPLVAHVQAGPQAAIADAGWDKEAAAPPPPAVKEAVTSAASPLVTAEALLPAAPSQVSSPVSSPTLRQPAASAAAPAVLPAAEAVVAQQSQAPPPSAVSESQRPAAVAVAKEEAAASSPPPLQRVESPQPTAVASEPSGSALAPQQPPAAVVRPLALRVAETVISPLFKKPAAPLAPMPPPMQAHQRRAAPLFSTMAPPVLQPMAAAAAAPVPVGARDGALRSSSARLTSLMAPSRDRHANPGPAFSSTGGAGTARTHAPSLRQTESRVEPRLPSVSAGFSAAQSRVLAPFQTPPRPSRSASVARVFTQCFTGSAGGGQEDEWSPRR